MDGISNDVLAQIPGMNPPEGQVTDFVGRYSLGTTAIPVMSVALALMIIGVVLRLYVRFVVLRKPGSDDFLIMASALTTVALSGVAYSLYHEGVLGSHQWNVRLTEVTPAFIKRNVAISCLYSVASMFVKCSLLVFYLRLFKVSRLASWMIWGGIVSIVVFQLTFLITKAVFCNPASWPSGNNAIEFLMAQNASMCSTPNVKVTIAEGSFCIFTDIYVMVIPITMVSSLQLPLKRKIGMIGIFLVGLLALGCSIATFRFRVKQLTSEDFAWISGYNILLGIVELNAGIICACIPVAFVVLRRITANPFVSSLKDYLIRISRRNGSSSNFNSGREKASWPPATGGGSMPHGGGGGGGDDGSSSSSQQGVLPRVHAPRAHMTGLRSFIGKVGRSGNRTQTGMMSTAQITKMSTLTTYSEVGSVEEEYHRSLRPAAVTVTSDTGALDGRTPPQTMRTINDRQV